MLDAKNEARPETSLTLETVDETTAGDSTDLLGFAGALAVLIVGAWTDGTHTFGLEDSDDDDGFDPVAPDFISGTLPAIGSAGCDGKTYAATYRGTRRYLRWSVTVTGSPATGCSYASSILAMEPKYRPI